MRGGENPLAADAACYVVLCWGRLFKKRGSAVVTAPECKLSRPMPIKFMTFQHKSLALRAISALQRARRGSMSRVATPLAKSMALGLLVASLGQHPAIASDAARLSSPSRAASALQGAAGSKTIKSESATADRRAKLERENASPDVRQMTDWIVDSGDNQRMPFIIIDKVDAKVFVFYADGRLRGAAPVLLGLARGDDSVPGIGQRKLSSIRPEERTTAAGRFVAALDRDLSGQEVLWVDYDAAVSLHRMLKGKPEERRAQRLASPTPLDNRISYGCINVAAKFYKTVVSRAFTRTNGIVYVLPDTRSLPEVFSTYYAINQNAQPQASAETLPARPADPIDFGVRQR